MPSECLTEREVKRYLEGKIEGREFIQIAEHIDGCVECHKRCVPDAKKDASFNAVVDRLKLYVPAH